MQMQQKQQNIIPFCVNKKEKQREKKHWHGPLMGMGKDSHSAVEMLSLDC